MKRTTALLMVSAFTLALAFTAAAQYDTPSPSAAPTTDMTRSAMGTVVSVSESSLVIKTENGDQMIFTRDTGSTIPVMVSVGSSVRVDYETPEPGVFHVSNVIVNAGGSDMTSQRDATTPSTTTTETEALPKTASPLPFVGLLGLMSLGGAVLIHSLHRK